MQKLRRVNIHKVAEIANVSAMTVTRSFNGSGSVAAKTKAKVLKVASELGYRPNIMAQSLRSGRTNSVGLLWSLGGPHDSTGLVRDISVRLMNKGYVCHVADSMAYPKIIIPYLSDFCRRKVDGIIFQMTHKLIENKEICDLLREISNVVVVTPEPFDCGFDTLVLDRTRAIRDIVDHFVAVGRRKIMYIMGADDLNRRTAFIEQLKHHNLTCDNDSIIFGVKPLDAGNNKWNIFPEILQHKFNRKMPFDALLVSCDEGAVAVINYLEKIGCKVPDDIAVTGFNDSAMASYFRPPLASVDRRNQDVMESVTRMLLNRIENPSLLPQQELLEMKFIHRESAG